MTERRIKVEAMTRVEGEGGLYVKLRDDAVEELRLGNLRTAAVVRGVIAWTTPGRCARYHGSDLWHLSGRLSDEQYPCVGSGLDITVTPDIRRLRRLLYCGEWIESHALHVYLLNAPDFLGYDSGLRWPKSIPTK